jgi:hypothetical protein
MRKGILPVIAGKPPADAAQPFGMNGMMVTVMTKVTTEPAAPRMLSRLSQKPERPFGDAQEPARAADAERGIHPPDQRTVADIRDKHPRFVLEPLLVTEEQKDDHHRGANDVVIEILREQAGSAQYPDKRIQCGAFTSVFIVVILSLGLIVQSLTRLRGSRCRCR